MRTLTRTFTVALFVSALTTVATGTTGSVVGSAAYAASSNAPAPELQAYPGVVALSEDKPGEWTYKKFPGNGRLYVSDRDPPGKSLCVDDCALAWPPLLADETDEPIGHWTVIERDSGTRQWAYKGKPAYTRFHNSPAQPSGNDTGGFRFLEP